MSFAASIRDGWLEYGLRTLDSIFAQRGNVVRPGYLTLLRDIFRFNARAEACVEQGMTIRDLLAAVGTARGSATTTSPPVGRDLVDAEGRHPRFPG